MFATREDRNLELLTQGPAPKHITPVYGQASYILASSSTSSGARSGSNPYAGSYHRVAKTTPGIPIGAPIFQSLAGTSSSPTSAASPDQDSTDDYLRSVEAPIGAPLMRVTSSSWWPQLEHLHTIVPGDIPPLGDQKLLMLGCPMMK
jgi:hypothetical protein